MVFLKIPFKGVSLLTMWRGHVNGENNGDVDLSIVMSPKRIMTSFTWISRTIETCSFPHVY